MSSALHHSGLKQDLKQDLSHDGTSWSLESRPGGWWVAQNPKGRRVRFFLVESANRVSFHLGKTSLHGELIESSESSSTGASIEADFIAQFPGKVRKILVATQQKVIADQKLILLEAMKMEFVIKAPTDGWVTQVRVHEGQQLSPGDVLLDFKASEKS